MTKSRIALVALAIGCIAMLGAGTAAYFTVQDTAYNVITTGILDMTLVEKTTDGAEPNAPLDELPDFVSNVGSAFNVMPGETVSKIPYVTNTGSADFYARIQLDVAMLAEDGVTTLPLEDENGQTMIALNISPEWTLGDDGWYYYNAAVLPEESSTPLFTGVTFAAQMGNAYQNATVTINVNAQAVQSRNNGDNALAAAGWPADDAQ